LEEVEVERLVVGEEKKWKMLKVEERVEVVEEEEAQVGEWERQKKWKKMGAHGTL
jgi:hypothetical protein